MHSMDGPALCAGQALRFVLRIAWHGEALVRYPFQDEREHANRT
jgi:hypothetical protein